MNIVDLLEIIDSENCLLLDVRSPAEFHKGHLPNARNLPLFSDEERAAVGTTYKQVSPQEALLEGLGFVGKKMPDYIRQTQAWVESPEQKIKMYCWRGGKRSGSLSWLLKLAAFDVETLEGGYKAYRQHVSAYFSENNFPFLVVGGKTGSGKTEILHALAQQGEQVLDFEGLANHKGSAFGSIGEKPQPSGEQFENNIFETLRKFDLTKRIWIENESRSVGHVFIPEGLWSQKIKAPLFQLELPEAERIEFLISVYARAPIAELIACFKRIEKRLGLEQAKNAILALENNDIRAATVIALLYYDKTYNHCLDVNATYARHDLSFEKIEPTKNAQELIRQATVLGY
jgi:tRNA 2-selenouridine synthase